MNVTSKTDPELYSWIDKSLNKELRNYEISLIGKSEKGDGYIGDIVFVNISGTTTENKKKILHWAIKHSKKNDHLRETVPIKAAFESEIHLYDKVFPVFRKFQVKKNILDVFESVPKCYNTLILDNMEVLVLDNIKHCGYELRDRKKALNKCHLKVILKEYGKLHALSFAMRDQRTKEFEKLAAFKHDVYKEILLTDNAKLSIRKSFDKALSTLRENGDLYLVGKLEKLIKTDPAEALLDLMSERESESVIIHGDPWNNNFMFKYQNADRTSPISVYILDWQASALRSPAFDLSYLLYATGSRYKLDELLQFYYAAFANFLRELGSNPDELFTYSSLQTHWRKYSPAGLSLVLRVLPMILCDKEEAPVFEDLKEGEHFNDMILLDIKDSDLYYKRLKSILSYHFDNTI